MVKKFPYYHMTTIDVEGISMEEQKDKIRIKYFNSNIWKTLGIFDKDRGEEIFDKILDAESQGLDFYYLEV